MNVNLIKYPLLLVAVIVCMGFGSFTHANMITGWVALAGDAGFSGGSAATASPITTSADADTIAANFDEITLSDGQSISLTGSVSIDVALDAQNQFRIGLFDGPAVMTGVGGGYEGYYAGNPSTALADAGKIGYGNGTGTIPFSSSAFTEYGILPDQASDPIANATVDFILTLTRDATTIDMFASFDDGAGYNPTIMLEDQVAPTFTFNTAAFLLGGLIDGNQATFTDITVIPEPASLTLLALGSIGLLRRRVPNR